MACDSHNSQTVLDIKARDKRHFGKSTYKFTQKHHTLWLFSKYHQSCWETLFSSYYWLMLLLLLLELLPPIIYWQAVALIALIFKFLCLETRVLDGTSLTYIMEHWSHWRKIVFSVSGVCFITEVLKDFLNRLN